MSRGVLAIVHARMGSSRLPGKAVADLNGMPLIEQILRRVKSCTTVDAVALATADGDENAVLGPIAQRQGADFVMGSEQDLLDRMEKTAIRHKADLIVRITGDNPFCDPDILDRMVKDMRADPVDFLANNRPPSFPYGLDLELITREALHRAWSRFPPGEDRETFTLAVTRENSGFTWRNLAHGEDLSALRWSVDYPKDLEVARQIFAALQPGMDIFGMREIMALLNERPDLKLTNPPKLA